jgi:hypothetical protein
VSGGYRRPNVGLFASLAALLLSSPSARRDVLEGSGGDGYSDADLKAAAFKPRAARFYPGAIRYDDLRVRHSMRSDGSTRGRRWNGARLVKYPANGSRP